MCVCVCVIAIPVTLSWADFVMVKGRGWVHLEKKFVIQQKVLRALYDHFFTYHKDLRTVWVWFLFTLCYSYSRNDCKKFLWCGVNSPRPLCPRYILPREVIPHCAGKPCSCAGVFLPKGGWDTGHTFKVKVLDKDWPTFVHFPWH